MFKQKRKSAERSLSEFCSFLNSSSGARGSTERRTNSVTVLVGSHTEGKPREEGLCVKRGKTHT